MTHNHLPGIFQIVASRRNVAIGMGLIAFVLALFAPLSGVVGVRAQAATTWTVTTTNDDQTDANCAGYCTLREAINAANNNTSTPNTIQFANGVNGIISVVNNGTLTVGNTNTPITINGPGATNLAIDGGSGITPFTINDQSVTVTLSGLTIENGNLSFGNGGGIYNGGTLIISNSTIASN